MCGSFGRILTDEGNDGPEGDDEEDDVHDGDPVLHGGPVVREDDPPVLEADTGHDDDPGPEQAAVFTLGSEDEKKSTAHTLEGVHDGVLDDGTEAHVHAGIAFVFEFVGEVDDIDDGGEDGDDDLDDADGEHCFLEGDAEATFDARSGTRSTHFHQFSYDFFLLGATLESEI